MRLHRRTVGIIPHSLDIGRARVKFLLHILFSELAESAGLDAEVVQCFVDFWEVSAADLDEQVVCESGAAVGSGYCC